MPQERPLQELLADSEGPEVGTWRVSVGSGCGNGRWAGPTQHTHKTPPHHSVDFTCHSIEQMTYLVKGISTLMAEQKRALLKARAAAAGGTGTEAPASPGRTTAAY